MGGCPYMRESFVTEQMTVTDDTFIAEDRRLLVDLDCFNAHYGGSNSLNEKAQQDQDQTNLDLF